VSRTGGPRAHRVSPFSVDDTTVQLTWSHLGPGPVRIRAADTTVDIEADGQPGGIVVGGLPSGTPLDVVLSGEGVPNGRLVVRTRTLDPLPGEELFRLATISDLHIGADAFGYRDTIVETDRPVVPHPMRCAGAAVEDLQRWGAQRLVVKGDVTDSGQPWEWRSFGRLVADAVAGGLALDVLPGNHDLAPRRSVEPSVGLASVGLGLELVEGVQAIDLPGLRLVLIDATSPGHHHGRLAHRLDAVVDVLRDAPAGALIALHHHLQPHLMTEGWPWGVPRHESVRFLDAVAAVHPNTLVTSGHTHRHRRWQRGPVTVTQVGSPKDYPGVWAGYVVYESGIRQIVRRITRPDCIAWTERTRAAAFGAWALTAPGRLSWRCFNLRWNH